MGLLDRKTEKVTTPVLEEGLHNVKVLDASETNDKISEIGSKIETDKAGWIDETPQIAIKFGSTENKGVFTHRYSVKGYKRYGELSPAEQAKCRPEGLAEYAVSKKTNMRIEDPARTLKSWEKVDKLCAHAGLEAGSAVRELVGKEVSIFIKANDQGRNVVQYSRKMSAVIAGAEDIDDGDL